ncbi:GTPase HflX [Balamuthia mandrillaris]
MGRAGLAGSGGWFKRGSPHGVAPRTGPAGQLSGARWTPLLVRSPPPPAAERTCSSCFRTRTAFASTSRRTFASGSKAPSSSPGSTMEARFSRQQRLSRAHSQKGQSNWAAAEDTLPEEPTEAHAALQALKPGSLWQDPNRPPQVMIIHPFVGNRKKHKKKKSKETMAISAASQESKEEDEDDIEKDDAATSKTEFLQLRLQEAVALTEALEWPVSHAQVIKVNAINAATFFGKGKIQELKALLAQRPCDILVIDSLSLQPTQTFNLASQLNCRVMDRFRLILEIFYNRAQSRESQCQVELASLPYQRMHLSTALQSVHLAQQRGGGAFLAGAGETLLELERRKLDEREKKLRQELRQISKSRELQQEVRKNREMPLVALLGYTNAGKSAILNRLAGTSLISHDMLFASLHSHVRGIRLPLGTKVLAADTVGFISDLPHDLVAPFTATLENINHADIMLHVRDVTHPEARRQDESVHQVLRQMNVDPSSYHQTLDEDQTAGEGKGKEFLEVWNKVDLLDEVTKQQMKSIILAKRNKTQHQQSQHPENGDNLTLHSTSSGIDSEALLDELRRKDNVFLISAKTGEGCDELLQHVEERIHRKYPGKQTKLYEFLVPVSSSTGQAQMNFLHRNGLVKEIRDVTKPAHDTLEGNEEEEEEEQEQEGGGGGGEDNENKLMSVVVQMEVQAFNQFMTQFAEK